MLFNPFDLVQYALVLIVTIICIIGIKKADKIPPKVICAITGLIFIASVPYLYILRVSGSKHDYVTSDDLMVKVGKLNKCEKQDVEKWTQELFKDWEKLIKPEFLKTSLKDKLLICLDYEQITIFDEYARGYNSNMKMVAGWNGHIEYVESLVKHESSHHIVESAGYLLTRDQQHDLFKKIGLGY